jgi:hypothetical protein
MNDIQRLNMFANTWQEFADSGLCGELNGSQHKRCFAVFKDEAVAMVTKTFGEVRAWIHGWLCADDTVDLGGLK